MIECGVVEIEATGDDYGQWLWHTIAPLQFETFVRQTPVHEAGPVYDPSNRRHPPPAEADTIAFSFGLFCEANGGRQLLVNDRVTMVCGLAVPMASMSPDSAFGSSATRSVVGRRSGDMAT
jgi:hypothetical protein